MRIKLLLFFFLLSVTYMVQAQDEDDDEEDDGVEEVSKEAACSVGCENGWCWGEQVDIAKEKWTLLDDNVSMKNYQGAEAPLEWLLTNAPCLNKALYINGEKVYKNLEKKAADDAAELAYQDKLMDLYYTRIKFFGKEKFVKQKIAQYAYAFYVNRGGNKYSEKRPHWTKMYNIYDDLVKMTEKDTRYYVVRYYMLSGDKMFLLDKDTTAFIELYDKCMEIVDHNLPKAPEKLTKKWEETKNAVEATFIKRLPIDCAFVKERWIPELKKNTDDIKLAKKSIRFMIQGKCTDDPDFNFLVETVYAKEPTAGMAKLLAQKYLADDNYAKAEEYYNEMIKMASGDSEDGSGEEDPAMQAEAHMAIAGIKAKQGQYSAARSTYLKAASIDNSVASKAYTRIGDLYMKTAKSCLPPAEERDPVSNTGAYLAAYEMYAKAGNNSKMASAKSGFPSTTDVFTWAKKGYKEGQSIRVYGWIGGSATLRTR